MRKIFALFFIISLLATAGTIYWRLYHPEGASSEVATAGARGANGVRGLINEFVDEKTAALPTREAIHDGIHKRVGAFLDRFRSDSRRSETRSAAPEARDDEASERQDWAVTVSIASSLISAIGALAQVWLTAKAARSGG